MSSYIKILVVGNPPIIQGNARGVLDAQGYETLGINEGKIALQVAQKYLPDLVLLPASMPELSGLEVCRQLKTDPQLKDVFVILFSATDSDLKYDELEIRADDTITQPITDQELLARVRAALRIRAAEKALRESEEKFKYIFEYSVSGKSIVLVSGEINANRIFGEMLGYSHEELQKKKWQEITHPNDLDLTETEFSALLSGERESTRFIKRYLHKNSSTVWVEEGVTLRSNAKGEPLYFLVSDNDITARRQAELAVVSSNSYLQAVLDSVNDAVFVYGSNTGQIIDVNRSMCEMYGYSRPEALHTSIIDLSQGRPPYSQTDMLEWLRKTREVGPQMFEWLAKHKDGHLFWAEVSIRFTVIDGENRFVFVVRDISERKQAENDLRHRVAELEVLYENSLTIGQLNSPRQIAQIVAENLSQKLKWHHAAVRLYHPETDNIELLALHLPDTDSENLLREIEHLRQTIQTSGDGLSGWVIRHGEAVYSDYVEADPRYLETYPGIHSGIYVPMKLGDVTVGCVSVESTEPAAFDAQDLRLLSTIASQAAIAIHQAQLYEQVQQYASELEKRVEERTADLRHANLELANASRMKDEFLASMSHELRTPLTSILGLSEALQLQTYGPLNERQLKSLKTVQGSGRHLLDLINDILDLSKIEAGKLDLQLEPCQVTDICQSSLNLVKGMAQQKKQNVNFSIDGTSTTVRADARRLKQMLVNLLSNAVKFTPEGGLLGLDVQASKAEKIIRFSVWDKGIGIAPEQMGKLFKPFTQLDSRLARQYSGTGLGLSLVQRMAELHGGSVVVESAPGEGSRFTILLPWASDVTQPVPDLKKSSTGTLKNALVIEDDEVDAENAARYLQAIGIKNISQPTLRGALEKAAFLHPSAILLDLNMPDGSGLDLLAKLKADERTRDIPIIIVSVEEQRAEAARLGALGYLVKPYTQQDLQTELDRVAAFSRPFPDTPIPKTNDSSASALIMLADDNDQILGMVSEFLEIQGYRVITTRSGFELLDRAPVHHPDLILVDIQMPGMDGLETIRLLRSHSDNTLASTPIIAVTALAMPGDYEKCIQAGANEYMSKPIALTKLLEQIHEFLKIKH